MQIRQLHDANSNTYSYLLWDEASREAVIIDPVREQFPRDCELIDQLELKLRYSLETHIHADHVTASGLLRERYDCQIGVHRNAGSRCVDLALTEGDRLKFGQRQLLVLHTPGHTDTDVCYLAEGNLFSGDTLLIRGSGRTDFQSGDPGLAYDSIQRLFTLPDDTRVYPAHDYRGLTSSTIGEERRFNPRLAGKSRDDYIREMQSLKLPKPKQIDIALPGNLECGNSGSEPEIGQ